MSAVADAVERHQLTETTLGALAEYITSGSRDWSKYYADSGAMFIRTQDINQNRLSLEDVAYVQLPAKVEGKRSLVRKGDLLITITGANVGKVAVVEQELPEAYVSQSVCLVRLKDPSLAKFLQLQLIARRGEKSALEAMAYGLGRPVLNLENVRAAPVKIGPPGIRADIVAEIEKQFSRLDEAVANLKRVKANLKRFEDAGIRDATQAAKRGSPIHRASELFSWSSGVNLPASKQDGGPVPVFGGNGITGYHSQSNIDQATVVIGRVGAGCGNVHLVREPAWITDNAIYATRVTESIFLPYAALMFSAAKLNSSAAGSGQPFVNQRMLNEVQMPLPSLDEQRRIVAEVDRRFSIVREVNAEVDANLQRAHALRQAVLARAFADPSELGQ